MIAWINQNAEWIMVAATIVIVTGSLTYSMMTAKPRGRHRVR
jgi:hypothetical protein